MRSYIEPKYTIIYRLALIGSWGLVEPRGCRDSYYKSGYEETPSISDTISTMKRLAKWDFQVKSRQERFPLSLSHSLSLTLYLSIYHIAIHEYVKCT